jgi:O-antigen ligase
VFLFFALSVSFKGSYAITGPLLVSSYLFLFFSEVRCKIALSSIEKGLVWVLLTYLLSVLLEVVIYQAPFRVMDPESKILLFIPLIYLLNAVRVPSLVIILAIGSGALGIFILAIYEKFFLGLPRVGSFINAIQLGNIAMALGFTSIIIAPLAYKTKKIGKLLLITMVVLGLLGFIASLFTLTRGGLLFAPVLLVVVCAYNVDVIKKHYKIAALALVIICVSGFLTIPKMGISDRFAVAIGDYQKYFDNGNATTSTGVRLELWKAATLISLENPFFGVGVEEYLLQKSKLIEQGVIKESVDYFGNPHNAYVYATARRGGVGLIVFLALLFYPVIVAHREIRQNNSACAAQSPAMALLIFGLFFVFANITQVLFAHNSGMIMYTGLLITLVYLTASLREKADTIEV